MTNDVYHILEIGDIIEIDDEYLVLGVNREENRKYTYWKKMEYAAMSVGTPLGNHNYPIRRKAKQIHIIEESIIEQSSTRKITII